jgi:hypothetical protein
MSVTSYEGPTQPYARVVAGSWRDRFTIFPMDG